MAASQPKTLRLLFPEWQGGANPNYRFSAQLLQWLAPTDPSAEVAEVPVTDPDQADLSMCNGIYAAGELIAQQQAALTILQEHTPDRVVTFGGDCSVSQAPFDYLHGRYPERTAILWVDAHPDISTPRDFSHEHVMVLGNLLGDGSPTMAELVEHPFSARDVLYVGLKADHLEPWEKPYLAARSLAYLTPDDLAGGPDPVARWVREGGYEQLLVHLDMDVLAASDFRSLLYNEPGLGPVEYATGSLTLKQAFDAIVAAGEVAPIVGLTFAEYLPWDEIRLCEQMGRLEILTGAPQDQREDL